MKIRTIIAPAHLSAIASLALAFSSTLASAQDYVISTFDTADDAARWSRWWGSAPQAYAFDAGVDANAKANSGALKATVDFNVGTFGGDNQFAVLRNFNDGATVDGTKYTNLVFDVRWDGASSKGTSGDFGYLEYGFRNSDWSQTWLGGATIPGSAAGNWIHVVAPIDPTKPKLDTVAGVVLKMWSGGGGGLTGQAVFWVDNVKLIANSNPVEVHPTMSLTKSTPGLQLTACGTANDQRQSIHTINPDLNGDPTYYSWVDAPNPVTYSVTVKDYPDAAHTGFQTHIFLVPENSMPYGAGDSGVDWNAGNVVFVQILNNADGSGFGRFMYKTNQPGDNVMLWNTDPANGPVGTIATLWDASIRGTWSVTFHNNTDITLTSPSGSTTNFAMPSAAAALFADPLCAYFGVQPNQANNVGQTAMFSGVEISGVYTPMTEDFTGPALNTEKWGIAAADASGVVQVQADAAYWLGWTAPAVGYGVQLSPSLAPNSWTDPGLTNIVQIGSQKMVVVPSALVSGPKTFFRVVKSN